MQTRLWATLVVLVSVGLAGCLSDEPADETSNDAFADGITTPFERETIDFDVTNPRSVTLEAGTYDILDGLDIYVEVPLDPTEGGQALNPVDGPKVHLGLFLPNIPGCDFDAITDMSVDALGAISGGEYTAAGDDCRVPIIADAGPYYATPGDQFAGTVPLFGEGDVPAAERNSGRLGEWMISNFVPHGYGVAQISVFGSGLSNHCFDMFGLAEQLGVHHAVEHLGKAGYSNGNVGLMGRSYDGSTPWMAAKHGSEHLKTIVPISGLSGLQDLVQWNGAAEGRIYTFHNVVYGRFGLDSNQLVTDLATHASCPDWLAAAPMGVASFVTGDDVVDVSGTYWTERDFIPGALQNYDGSLYMIHGLLDANVQPHAGWIAELALRDKGNDVKAMWGQWGHMYPDRLSEHGFDNSPESIRMDWAQDMLEWFDHYLMETGPKPSLHTEMQQLDGTWRFEADWPPNDAIIRDVPLGEGVVIIGQTAGPTDVNLGVLSADEDVLMAGFTHVTLSVTPQATGGQVAVELFDATEGTDFGLSWGIMDVRYAGEGSAAPVTPGESIVMDIPIQLFDAVLPAGHELGLRLSSSAQGFSGAAATNVNVELSESILHLSTLERGPETTFTPPVWWDETDDGIVQKGQDTEE